MFSNFDVVSLFQACKPQQPWNSLNIIIVIPPALVFLRESEGATKKCRLCPAQPGGSGSDLWSAWILSPSWNFRYSYPGVNYHKHIFTHLGGNQTSRKSMVVFVFFNDFPGFLMQCLGWTPVLIDLRLRTMLSNNEFHDMEMEHGDDF